MQDIIRHLPAVIYEYVIYPGRKPTFTFVSDTATNLLGIQPAAILNDPASLYAAIHEEDIKGLKEALNRSPDPGKACSWKGRIRKGIDYTWIEVRSTDWINEAGVIFRRGIILDYLPDKVLSESNNAYETLLEKLPIGVSIHYQGIIVFANSQANLIMGAKKPADLLGVKAMDFVHPDYKTDILERIKKVSEGNSVPMLEERFIRLDGKVIDVETMAVPFVYNGQPAIQVIFRDITERKKIHAENKKNETLFTQLFENLPMGVVMLDSAGKVFQVNRGFKEMFGYDKNELRGKNLNDFIVPEELRNEGIDLNNLIASNQVVSIESIRKHRSGKLVNVILCGVPVLLDNETIGIYGVYVDISDRKKVEEELKVRNTELDNFVYKVSHDLRAPLSSVLGLVNLSRLQGNTDSPLEYIGIIGEKIQALDNFIGDVLSHSKNLKMHVAIAKVDLQKIIEQTFTGLSYLEGASEIKHSVVIEGIEFFSDHWRVSEIFRNLISNAIKYRRPDSGDSEVAIKIHVDNLRADVNFADNGIGIKESSLKRIFEMFFRATEQSEGSGIGLYIVKNAVEKLGGQITVASTPGAGTHFHIVLPNNNSLIKTAHIEGQHE
jgi:PAS domain S-box-containing protein